MRLWTLSGDGAPRTLALHGTPIRSMDVTPDGRLLATTGEEGDLLLTEIETGSEAARWDLGRSASGGERAGGLFGGARGGASLVSSLALHTNGKKVFAVTNRGECLIFDRGRTAPTTVFAEPPGDETDWWRALVREERPLPTLLGLRSVRGRSAWAGHVSVRPSSGLWVARLSHRSIHVRLWAGRITEWALSLPGPPTPAGLRPGVSILALHPLIDVVVVADTLGSVRLLDIWTGDEVVSWKAHDAIVTGLALSSDGAMIATAGPDGAIRLWDGLRGERLAEIGRQEDGALCLRFSPDDRLLASGGVDGTILLWDVPARTLASLDVPPGEGPLDLDLAWKALRSREAGPAVAAMRRLVSHPAESLPFLEARLQPLPMEGPADGSAPAPAVLPIREPTSETLGQLRGIQVLERLGRQPETRVMLLRLSEGAKGTIPAARAHDAILRIRACEPGDPG